MIAIVILIAVLCFGFYKYCKYTDRNPPHCGMCNSRDDMCYFEDAKTWLCTKDKCRTFGTIPEDFYDKSCIIYKV